MLGFEIAFDACSKLEEIKKWIIKKEKNINMMLKALKPLSSSADYHHGRFREIEDLKELIKTGKIQ